MEGGGFATVTTASSSSLPTNGAASAANSATAAASLQQDIHLYQQEIPTLIQQLHDTIHKKLLVTAVTPSQRAVTTRYEQVLRDTKSDYERTQQQYIRHTERNELFSNGGSSTVSSGNGTTNDPAMEALLRERNSMQNSMSHASNIVHQAESIRSELHSQGRALRNTNSVVGMITNNVPGINTLIDTIRRRRNSDDKIVAITIAGCVTFTLWYLFG
jgi:golgi SNAP receptor complex member 1